MTYLVDQAKAPSNFVVEDVPPGVKDNWDFEKAPLYSPLHLNRWPLGPWTIDKQRQVALAGGETDARAAGEANTEVTHWTTFLMEGQSVGIVHQTGVEMLEGADERTGSQNRIELLTNVYLYLPPTLYPRKDEIIAMIEEAHYVRDDGPNLPWVKGVRLELKDARLDTEYWRAKHGA
ncbi:hypothetical protein [Hydrogenophaga sp. 5NK40-0174]|uniref:hypothetical protein n=1 Tax=Hydrogenophaga sp. 5NK40-0174 TaxID=3127649 RepID=UPI003109633A